MEMVLYLKWPQSTPTGTGVGWVDDAEGASGSR